MGLPSSHLQIVCCPKRRTSPPFPWVAAAVLDFLLYPHSLLFAPFLSVTYFACLHDVSLEGIGDEAWILKTL